MTPELQELEERILTAEERQLALEASISTAASARSPRAERIAPAFAGAVDARRAGRLRRGRGRRTATAGPQMDAGGPASRSATAATRWSSVCGSEPFVPNDTELDGDGPRSSSSPDRTWAASRPTCGRWRCSSLMAQAGSFVPADAAAHRRRRPHLHPRRRQRRPGARRVDLHGRDDRDRQHPASATAAESGHPRRGRPGHGDLRRPVAGLGDRRAPARAAAGR